MGALVTICALAFAAWVTKRAVRLWRNGRRGLAVLVATLSAPSVMLAGMGALFTLMATYGFRRGRQLRRGHEVLLPRVSREGATWVEKGDALDVAKEVAPGLAAQWRENGRTEHASVGAFAKLTLDLMALGAPPTLVAAANRDSLDEIRHTQLCFTLARGLDGRAEGPGPFPETSTASPLRGTRTMKLAQLAVDSLVDGALHEGVSARVVAKLVSRCQVPAIRAVLKEIAADEGRHAAHGWDVVEWCVAEGGQPVRDALLGALPALPDEVNSGLPDAAATGAWEVYGIPGRDLEASEYARARENVTRRVRALCEGRRKAA
ncbi:MAG: ferritin-like domain-containing protein [Myxococcota bacterium]